MPRINRASASEYQRQYRLKNADIIRRKRKAYHERKRDHMRELKRFNRHGVKPTRPEPAACEVCGCKQKKRLFLDHDHALGIFRGWLCSTCNTALGMAKDSPFILRALADYLERAWYKVDGPGICAHGSGYDGPSPAN